MKNITLMVLAAMAIGCSNSDDSTDGDNNTGDRDYKQDMRDFVIGISQKAKAVHAGFAVIPQNGIELVTQNGEESGSPATAYLDAIDANGQEDLLYGYDNDNEATPGGTTTYLKNYLDISKAAGNTILAIDYCSTASKIADSYAKNAASGYISYAAEERGLNIIPSSAPYNENAAVVTQLSEAKNFLYLINPENYASKASFISAVTATNYDAYYWNSTWNSNKPDWIAAENPDWPGNYKVKYWNAEWQGLVYKNDDSYLDKILTAGFDGVYLDIIDAFEYFE
jgi:cysteinyl-tRNA synthetase